MGFFVRFVVFTLIKENISIQEFLFLSDDLSIMLSDIFLPLLFYQCSLVAVWPHS